MNSLWLHSRTQRLGQEVRVTWRRAGPGLDAILQTQLLCGLEDDQGLGRGEVQHHRAAGAGVVDQAQSHRAGVVDRDVVGLGLDRHVGGGGDRRRAGGDVAGARHVGLIEGDLVRMQRQDVLRGAVGAVARAHVDRGAVGRRPALRRDAGAELEDPRLGPQGVIDGALDDVRRADDAEHVVGLDQLVGGRRDLRRLRLIGLDEVLDRVAVDAAVVVDAGEVRLGHRRLIGEVGPRLLGVDRAEVDRRARRLHAGLGTARRDVDAARAAARTRAAGGGRRPAAAAGGCRRSPTSTAATRAVAPASGKGHQRDHQYRREPPPALRHQVTATHISSSISTCSSMSGRHRNCCEDCMQSCVRYGTQSQTARQGREVTTT